MENFCVSLLFEVDLYSRADYFKAVVLAAGDLQNLLAKINFPPNLLLPASKSKKLAGALCPASYFTVLKNHVQVRFGSSMFGFWRKPQGPPVGSKFMLKFHLCSKFDQFVLFEVRHFWFRSTTHYYGNTIFHVNRVFHVRRKSGQRCAAGLLTLKFFVASALSHNKWLSQLDYDT